MTPFSQAQHEQQAGWVDWRAVPQDNLVYDFYQ